MSVNVQLSCGTTHVLDQGFQILHLKVGISQRAAESVSTPVNVQLSCGTTQLLDQVLQVLHLPVRESVNIQLICGTTHLLDQFSKSFISKSVSVSK